MTTDRPRHPKPELEALIKDAEKQGWRVTKRKKYYMARCPCDNKCQETVHLSPSDPNYARNKRGKMAKCDEWKD